MRRGEDMATCNHKGCLIEIPVTQGTGTVDDAEVAGRKVGPQCQGWQCSTTFAFLIHRFSRLDI